MTEQSKDNRNLWRKALGGALASVIVVSGVGCVSPSVDEINKSPVAKTAVVSPDAIPKTEFDPTTLSATPSKSPEVTATPTVEVTPRPTETVTAMPTEISYEINIDRMNTMPESWAAFLANPEKYQPAPNPVGTGPGEGPEVFQAWFDALTAKLGPQSSLPRSLRVGSCGIGSGDAAGLSSPPQGGRSVESPPLFSYFTDEAGGQHPILGFSLGTISGKGDYGTFFIILDQSHYFQRDGFDSIAAIHNGGKIGDLVFIVKQVEGFPINDQITKKLVESPFNWNTFLNKWETGDNDIRYSIGVGDVGMMP